MPCEKVMLKIKRNIRLPKEIRMRQIEKAALTIFRSKGYKDGSTSEIAREAGVAEGLIFKYYETKVKILEAVICTWYDGVLRNYKCELEKIENPEDKLRYAIENNLRCMCDDVNIANLYLELRRDRYFRSSKLIAYNKKYVGAMVEIIEVLQSKKDEDGRRIRPTLVSQMIYSMIEARSESHRFGEKELDFEKAVNEIYELSLKVI